MRVSDVDDEQNPYGPSPMRRVMDYLHIAPALGAVVVELVFVLIVCNQWMVRHVAMTSGRGGVFRSAISDTITTFPWSLTPPGDYTWIWLGSIAHGLVWLLATFLLVRVSLRAGDRGAQFVASVGSVLIAYLVAGVVHRLVSYSDTVRMDEAAGLVHAKVGLLDWVLFGGYDGSPVVVAVIGVLAALVAGQLAIAGDRAAKDDAADLANFDA
jgi:hypothetical protein